MRGLLPLTFLFASCASPEGDSRAEEIAVVARIRGSDRITHEHIRAILRLKGIQPVFNGSMVHGVFVPKRDLETASSVLREDAKSFGYFVEFEDGTEVIPADKFETAEVNQYLSDALENPKWRGLPVGRFLRDDWLQKSATQHDFVKSVQWKERNYFDPGEAAQGRAILVTGYDVEASLQAAPEGGGGKLIAFQVLR